MASLCMWFESHIGEHATLIWELYKFEWGHNTIKATKNICCTKGEGTVDYNTVIRWFKKSYSDGKNLDNQGSSGRLKTGFQSCALSHRGKFYKSPSSMLLVTFKTSAKAFRVAELSITYYQNSAKLLPLPCVCVCVCPMDRFLLILCYGFI